MPGLPKEKEEMLFNENMMQCRRNANERMRDGCRNEGAVPGATSRSSFCSLVSRDSCHRVATVGGLGP